MDGMDRRKIGMVALGLAMAASGCRGTGARSDRLVPGHWRGNGWGPEAQAARDRGELQVVPPSPPMVAWDAWGRANLRDGDVAFRMGDSRAFFGLLPFSDLSAAMADSRFSHTGIVAIEAEAPVVYDTNKQGPRRQPFAAWALDAIGPVEIRRPRPEHQRRVPAALAYCREVYRRETPFDHTLKLDDDELYCAEMVEKAYRSAGLPLCEPTRIADLPRYGDFPGPIRLIRLLSSLEPDQAVVVPGNERIGLLSSPALGPPLVAPADPTRPAKAD